MTRDTMVLRRRCSAAAAAAACLVLVGCGGSEQDDGSAGSSPASSEHTGDPVTLVELTFTPVAGMAEYTNATNNAKLTLAEQEWVAEREDTEAGEEEGGENPGDGADQDGPTPATVLVFLEKRNAIDGTMMLNESEIEGWDDEAEVATEELDIPGTAEAALMKSHYTAPDDDHPSEQWDIVLGMDTTPQYHIRYGAPEDEFDEEAAEAMLESIQVESEYE